MKKLTKAQERAKGKLTTEWQTAYEIQETIPTLEGLVSRNLAVMKYDLGSYFSPRTSIYFKLKNTIDQEG